jgi:5-methylcytosine-specific restriction protein A
MPRRPPQLRTRALARSTSRLKKKPWAHLYRTQRWRRMAKHQVDVDEPLCRMCKAEGRLVQAEIADHVKPHRGDENKFWNGELQSLCARHHLRKLNHEQYERRTGKPYRRRSGCDASGMPTDPEHPWHRERGS